MANLVAEFEYGGLKIEGCSLAGEETCILVPEMNVAFDIGRAPQELLAIDHVFLSHGHMDHAAGIAYYFSQRMFVDNSPGHVYMPQPLVEPAKKLLRLWAEIDGHVPPANIHPALPGQDIQLRRDLVMRPFRVNHPCRRQDRTVVEALGFAAIEVRQKLKEEYAGRSAQDYVELKNQGIEITRRIEIPLVAYCGDTAPGDWIEHDFVRNAKILLLECTFVEHDHLERARAGYHIHISDLRQIVPRLANERILLTHLSRRTPLHEAKGHLRRELGAEMASRLSFFMEHRRRRRPPPREDAVADK